MAHGRSKNGCEGMESVARTKAANEHTDEAAVACVYKRCGEENRRVVNLWMKAAAAGPMSRESGTDLEYKTAEIHEL